MSVSDKRCGACDGSIRENEMPLETLNTAANFGIAGAVIVVVILFLKHLKDEREAFSVLIQNHLHQSAALWERAVDTLDQIKETLVRLNGKGK